MNEAIFFEKIYRIINKYNVKSKEPREYGKEKMILYSSETHMIEIIGTASKLTTTQIAKEMAITKGAVSQTTSKLLQKDLIKKIHVEATANTSLISLTEKGKEVFEEHRKFHEKMLKEINRVLESASEETRRQLNEILDIIDKELDNY